MWSLLQLRCFYRVKGAIDDTCRWMWPCFNKALFIKMAAGHLACGLWFTPALCNPFSFPIRYSSGWFPLLIELFQMEHGAFSENSVRHSGELWFLFFSAHQLACNTPKGKCVCISFRMYLSPFRTFKRSSFHVFYIWNSRFSETFYMKFKFRNIFVRNNKVIMWVSIEFKRALAVS